MTTTILVVWTVFLVLALGLTLIDVYLLGNVVRLSKQIKQLTAATLPAAVGIVGNTNAAGGLTQTIQLISALKLKTEGLDPLSAAVVRRLKG
jgi:uncharacterized protein YoxC